MNNGTASNAHRLLWAGFFAIFASGVIFSIRGGILSDWAKDYGFTMTELGEISGGGLWGFGLIIMVGAFIAEKIGYGRLMIFALTMHVLSAVLQLSTDKVYGLYGKQGVYWTLTVAQVMMAVANGTCEAVVNPMVAALFPKQKTHYLNILHAGWPGGLVCGGALSYFMNGNELMGLHFAKVPWLFQMSIFLVPVAIYGAMIAGQSFPKSEAGAAGIGYGTMLLQFLSPILILLLVAHALVGYVELGTDSWISKITGAIMVDPGKGMLLFTYTSALMFLLRFYAGPIEHRLSPLGLLFVSGIIGAIGLTLLSSAQTVIVCVLAATVYAVGKTFLWPTMLAVASERFPKGGSLTIGAMGGVGMLSAGLLGAPGIGFKQDHFASTKLKQEQPGVYKKFAAASENTFLGIFKTTGLDGTKVAILDLATKEAATEEQKIENAKELEKTLKLQKPEIIDWWNRESLDAADDKKPVDEAGLYGGRMALQLTAAVPAAMAVIYLLLILYFKATGGYTKVIIDSEADKAQEMMNRLEG